MPEQLETLDRRSHLRSSVGCDITLVLRDSPPIQVSAMNLSASGAYCVSSRSLGELTRVDMTLRFYTGEDVAARAVVIREEELSDGSYGLGLFFTRISEEDRFVILGCTAAQRIED